MVAVGVALGLTAWGYVCYLGARLLWRQRSKLNRPVTLRRGFH